MTPTWQRDGLTVYQGHVLDVLRELPAGSVQACVTSPPYWGLRDYGLSPQVWDAAEGCGHEWGDDVIKPPNTWGTPNKNSKPGTGSQGLGLHGNVSLVTASRSNFCSLCNGWRGSLGLEPTPAAYIAHLLQVFDAVRRVLRDDGVLFVVIADSYFGDSPPRKRSAEAFSETWDTSQTRSRGGLRRSAASVNGLKPKDLCLIPERFGLAMQDAGWWVRSRIVWAKKAPMPESVTDRPTSAHETVWMFTKSARYYWDAEGVRESLVKGAAGSTFTNGKTGVNGQGRVGQKKREDNPAGRNIRNVWHLGPEPLREAHYAAYPSEIPRRCIKAATSERGCCPMCGKPWVRVVEKEGRPSQDASELRELAEARGILLDPDNPGVGSKGRNVARLYAKRESPASATTLGWRPACTCYPRMGEWREYITAKPGKDLTLEQEAENERIRAIRAELLTYWQPMEVRPCTILDPFLGSGTTLAVAAELGRAGIGIELSEAYLTDIAIPRLEDAVKQMRMPL